MGAQCRVVHVAQHLAVRSRPRVVDARRHVRDRPADLRLGAKGSRTPPSARGSWAYRSSSWRSLFIYRAAGRIDPGAVSRLGYVSVWMMALMLPLLLHAAWGVSSVAAHSHADHRRQRACSRRNSGGLLTLQGIGHRALESDAAAVGGVRRLQQGTSEPRRSGARSRPGACANPAGARRAAGSGRDLPRPDQPQRAVFLPGPRGADRVRAPSTTSRTTASNCAQSRGSRRVRCRWSWPWPTIVSTTGRRLLTACTPSIDTWFSATSRCESPIGCIS